MNPEIFTLRDYAFLSFLGWLIFAAGIAIGAGIQGWRKSRERRRRQGVTMQPLSWTSSKRTLADYATRRGL